MTEDKPGVHVHVTSTSEGKRWAVRRSLGKRALQLHDVVDEAIASARYIAKQQGLIFYLHSRDGRIEKREDYRRRADAS